LVREAIEAQSFALVAGNGRAEVLAHIKSAMRVIRTCREKLNNITTTMMQHANWSNGTKTAGRNRLESKYGWSKQSKYKRVE